LRDANARWDVRDDAALVLLFWSEQSWGILAVEVDSALLQRFACSVAYFVAQAPPNV
jgi:hypothetical protein